MANNYTQFSFQFDIATPAEAEYIESVIQAADEYGRSGYGKTLPSDKLELLEEVFDEEWFEYSGLGFEVKIDAGPKGGSVWIWDGGGEGDPNHAAELVQAYLKKFKDDRTIAFSFAQTCSKPRLDEFGGGAVVITKTDQDWMSTWEFISARKEAARKMEIAG